MKLTTLRTLAVAAVALCTAGTVNAQTLYLSTYAGTDLARYDNKTINVKVNRYVFNGWNTISLPFDLSEAQIEEAFGDDCRLEALVGVENNAGTICLNFQDCKAEGIKANTPYILHYTGENTTKQIVADGALVRNNPATVSFTDYAGTKVTFAGAQKQTASDGLYGILARDNSEAAFVNVSGMANGFYATRCFIEVEGMERPLLTINHLDGGQATGINGVLRNGEKADVYSVGGSRIATNATASQISAFPTGVYVVNGKKVVVK